MAINIKVSGVQEAARAVEGALNERRDRLGRAVALTTLQGHERMVRMISGAGSGKMYGSHRASAPGDPPAKDLGDYARSWRPEVDKSNLTGEVATHGEYAQRGAWLEGLVHTKHMAPRPHIGPVAEQMKGDWIANAKDALR